MTLGAALLVLLRPAAYPLLFVATICLAIRGVGALVAAGLAAPVVRLWMLARGAADLILAGMLMVGAPLAALISTISGVRWPEGAGLVLVNFVGLSVLVTGLALLGIGRSHRRSSEPAETGAAG